jgi:hypothetical protein
MIGVHLIGGGCCGVHPVNDCERQVWWRHPLAATRHSPNELGEIIIIPSGQARGLTIGRKPDVVAQHCACAAIVETEFDHWVLVS